MTTIALVGDTAATIVARVAAKAAQTPHAPAVADEHGVLSYADLLREAGATAAALREAGVRPGDAVILSAERTRHAAAAVVGIAAAGAAYVPVDAKEPPARVSAIVEGSEAVVALADEGGESALAGTGMDVLELAAAAASGDGEAPHHVPEPQELAYVLFTSGSTGRPKGVEIPHRSLGAFLDGSRRWAGLTGGDCMACFHAFTFDISIWEIWGPLVSGAQLFMLPRLAQIDAELLLGLVRERRVTRLCQTPTALRQLAAAARRQGVPPDLRTLFICGERLDFAWLRPFAGAIERGQLEAWNLYGPTETTIYATGRRISAPETEHERRSLIGTALPHVSVSLRSANGAPPGVADPAEIEIGGPGVGAGYRGGGGSTTRFVRDEHGRRSFLTGDLARLVPEGELEFVGRTEGFVKIRGYRIEPDEVATALCGHDTVADAAAVDVDFLPGGVALAAAVVPAAGGSASEIELRRYLGERLPSYMRPARIAFVDRLPRLPSAKLDRPSLRALLRKLLEPPPG